MPSSTTRTTTRESATSAAITNVAPTQKLHPSHQSNPSSATYSDSCWEGDSSNESLSDTYADPDTEADTDVDPGDREDARLVLEKDSEPYDSEAEEILKDIAQLRAEGPAKPNHTKHTTKLWKREREFWERYCDKIKRSPEEQLRACEPEIFKAYLRWRKKHSRVKKESSMRSYWKRLSMCYMDHSHY